MVVDDEETIRQLAARMLEKRGYKVLTAQEGSEAIEHYRRQGDSISLILLDMTMPRMDGKQTFRELLKLDPEVRVILSSGYNEESVSGLLEEGLSGFLQKPYRPQDLLGAVRRACAKHEVKVVPSWAGMAKPKKSICKWERGEFEKHYSLHPSVVKMPRFACRECGRVARKKKWLCKAFKLSFKKHDPE